MTTFYSDDIDIDPSDFVDACDRQEIQELIDVLIEDGYIKQTARPISESREDNLMDLTYKNAIEKLLDKRIYLTLEEEQFIINLASKY
jgi:uncharacterized protein YdaT